MNALAGGKGQRSDSYLIRVYRRGADGKVAGLIERIGNGKRQAFGSSKELWDFLIGRHPGKGVTKGKQYRSTVHK
jgi:hypothetical protein